MMRVDHGGFVREYPTEVDDADIYREGAGFDCTPDNITTLRGDYGAGAKASR
jgi:hypothetical protein